MLRNFLTIFLLFVTIPAFSERATFLLQPGPLEGFTVKRKCYRAQTPVYFLEKTVSFTDSQRQYNSYVERIPTAGRSPEVDNVVNNILYDWENVHGYTTAQNIAMLRDRDKKLATLRTTYLIHQFAENSTTDFFNTKRMGLRVYDGSTRILRYGQEWQEASASRNVSPLELSDPNFDYPGRAQRLAAGKDFYYIELGLLSVNPELMGGIQSAFNQVATQLDFHYNDAGFKFFGKTTEIQSHEMMVFGQTREHQLETFRKYGLEPVLDKNGQPIKLGSGLYLIAAPASRFIELNFGYHYFASPRSEGPYYDSEKMKAVTQQRQKETLWLDQQRLAPMNSTADVRYWYRLVVNMRDELINLPPRHPEREHKAMLFVGTYLAFVNSVPAQFHPPNWQSPRKLILASMTALTFVDAYIHLNYLMVSSAKLNSYVPRETINAWKEKLPKLEIPKPYVDFSSAL